jgi:hypothetical protein
VGHQRAKSAFARAMVQTRKNGYERGTIMETKGDYEIKKVKKICVKCYFNPETFKAIAIDAEAAGKRRGGLLLFTQKSHGFAQEQVSNTDGISRFLKHCWAYWREHETERLQEAAKIAEDERGIAERKRKLALK